MRKERPGTHQGCLKKIRDLFGKTCFEALQGLYGSLKGRISG
jgi:hypothetical protein